MTPVSDGTRIHLAELIELRRHTHEIPLFSTPQRRSPLAGMHHSKLRGRGVDFDQVRLYQPGDDVRHIDWRVTARTLEPHTKVYHEERERPIYILVEQSPRLFFGTHHLFKSVLAAQAAALIGWTALKHSDQIGGLIFGHQSPLEVRPRRNKHSLLQLLERLAKVNNALPEASNDVSQSEQEPLKRALQRAREVLRPGSLAIILCDERAIQTSIEQQLSVLSRHIDLLLLPVFDPIDHALPAAGILNFTQGNALLRLNSHDAKLRQRYRQAAQERQNRWQWVSQRLGVPLLPLSTGQEARIQLHEHLIRIGSPR